MNKNLKKIIAVVLAVGTISAVAPATSVNLLTTKAYATAGENTEKQVDSFELETSSGSNIKIYDDNDYSSDNKVDKGDIDEGDTYYAKTSSNKIKVNIDGIDDKYIKVFKSTSDSAKGKDVDDDITLSSGTTTITVKIYDQEPESNVRYDNDNEDADDIGEYTIKVKYTGDSSDTSDEEDNADNYDSIYLDKLTVDGEPITLSDSKVTYAYNVASNVSQVVIKALPDDEDNDTVTIDGTDSDKFRKTVSLTTGVNKFEIEVEDDDNNDNRTYTLNITRAAAVAQPVITTPAVTVKAGWVQVAGRWQYNDSLGRTQYNQWFWDKNYSKYYYLGADGFMQTGWIFNGGKYYYLNSDGSMATNTTIGGYKVGNDGAWIR